MAYQVLARKWRPQDFSSVVGQEPIVTALRNALSEGRIAQAYLFSGIRGVGKTSVARILAKALNCERGPAADPCNECTSCTEITASTGSNLDVHEIDAATHSKVEQVRDLTEGLKYGPARDRYKVVIIDEIHRLSRQAFDALLKIVEEPPPHLVFIFATTEAEAVPVTILSRCQEFRFRRVPSQALAEHLRQLSEAEEIEVSDKALRLIARAGDGSVRDAVALLDQLSTFGSGEISDDEAARILGGVDHALFHRLLAAIIDGDAREVSAIVGEVEGQGWDPRHVYGEFLNYGRDALHLALGGGVADVDLPEEEAKSLSALSGKAGYENLLRLVHQLLASENTVRRSETGSLALEICWLRAAELPKLVRIEEILGGELPQAGSTGSESSGSGGSGPERGPSEAGSQGEGEPPQSGKLFSAAARAAGSAADERETNARGAAALGARSTDESAAESEAVVPATEVRLSERLAAAEDDPAPSPEARSPEAASSKQSAAATGARREAEIGDPAHPSSPPPDVRRDQPLEAPGETGASEMDASGSPDATQEPDTSSDRSRTIEPPPAADGHEARPVEDVDVAASPPSAELAGADAGDPGPDEAPTEQGEPAPPAPEPMPLLAQDAPAEREPSPPAAGRESDGPPETPDSANGGDEAPAGGTQTFLDEVSRRKQPLAAHLREAHRIVFDDRTLRIFAPPGDPWLNPAALNRKTNRRALEGALTATFGEGAGWKLVECEAAQAPSEPDPEPDVQAAAQDPRVQKVLDIFGGHAEALDDN